MNNFLMSITEEQMFLMNINNEVFRETTELMRKEHFTIVKNESKEIFVEDVKAKLTHLINRFKDLVKRFIIWVKDKFQKAVNAVLSKYRQLKSKVTKDDSLTAEVSVDVYKSTINLKTNNAKLKQVLDIASASAKASDTQISSSLDRFMSLLKGIDVEGTVVENKTLYRGSELEKLNKLANELENIIKDINNSAKAVQAMEKTALDFFETFDIENFGTLSSRILMYTSVNSLFTALAGKGLVVFNNTISVIDKVTK